MGYIKSLDEAIVPSKCVKTKQSYDIIFKEKSKNVWEIVAVIKTLPRTKDTALSKVERKTTAITGLIQSSEGYKCPYCFSSSFYKCNACNSVNCWDGKIREVTCAHCGDKGTLSGALTSLDVADPGEQSVCHYKMKSK